MTSPVSDAMPQMVASAAMAYRSVTGGAVNYDAMQAALEVALPLAMKAKEEAADQSPADERMLKWHMPTMLRWLAENITAPRLPDGTLTGRFLYAVAENIEGWAIRNGDEGMGQMTSMTTGNAPGEARVRPNR